MGIAPVKIPGRVQICNVFLSIKYIFVNCLFSVRTLCLFVLMSSLTRLLEFSCIAERKITIMKDKHENNNDNYILTFYRR